MSTHTYMYFAQFGIKYIALCQSELSNFVECCNDLVCTFEKQLVYCSSLESL